MVLNYGGFCRLPSMSACSRLIRIMVLPALHLRALAVADSRCADMIRQSRPVHHWQSDSDSNDLIIRGSRRAIHRVLGTQISQNESYLRDFACETKASPGLI
ncbi:hypothetical protein DOTSEDRAFT_74623 [Dothistroma septosporum NZE10]|uniref:Uncharacterized protein n=1 Tax=Dothistroma septosporum (strain NZE10 / CBS 128990) TaxID=675120 RepID=N1PET1_DOTSN|nr:hypothetical protein DOTSEDRAFT_74623 [Dothistroma septosporum NZE10]